MSSLLIKTIPTFSRTANVLHHHSRRLEYQSAYNLKNLYPLSNPNITTPSVNEIPKHDNQKFSGYIPVDKLLVTVSRASGPGGQRVNKINTKVEVRFHLQSADWIPDDLKRQLLEKKKNQLTKEGYLIFRSDKTRSQQLNMADVLQRIRHVIYKCEDPVMESNPETEMEIRKRKERANEKRLKMKRHMTFINQLKKGSDFE